MLGVVWPSSLRAPCGFYLPCRYGLAAKERVKWLLFEGRVQFGALPLPNFLHMASVQTATTIRLCCCSWPLCNLA